MEDDTGEGKTTPGQKPPRVGGAEGGEVLSGRYKLLRFLAAGGMGEVWEAEDQSLNEHVALKTVRPETLDEPTLARFRSEVKLARSISHRNICRVFEFGEHVRPTGEKITFLTMELLRGLPLEEIIRRQGKLSVAQALPLLEQMASALGAAHELGIIHRDFKSPNVFIEDHAGSARVVVTDFGLARALGSDARLTAAAQMMGTPAYMAPEQVEGADAGPAADLYALGVVAFEMVTGKLPFTGENAMAIAVKRLTQPAPGVRSLEPEVPEHWEQALQVALSRKPEHRFASTTDFIAALKGGPAPASLPSGPAVQPASAQGAWRGWAAALGGLAALAAIGIWLGARQRDAKVPAAPEASAENSGGFVLRRSPENKWVIDVDVPHDEREKIRASASKLGFVAVVTPAGFFLGATGGILSGIPRAEGAALDYATYAGTLRRIKKAYPLESTAVIVCQTGVSRADCDRARILAAEDSAGPLFPDQWLVEGEFVPGYQGGGAKGFDVRFTDGLMPARRLTPARLAELEALYPGVRVPSLEGATDSGAAN